MIPPDARADPRIVELRGARERELSAHEAIEPLVLRLTVHRHVPAGEPIPRDQYVDIVVESEIVAEVGDVPRVAARGTDEIVDAEVRKQNPASPAASNVREDERQPHDGDVADIEHRRPSHHGVLVDPFDLPGGEMVIGHRLRIGGKHRLVGVDPPGIRIGREPPAAHVPRDAALLEVGQRVPDGATPQARVVAHPFPNQHRAVIEQLRVSPRVELAACLVIADRVGLHLGALAVDERFPPQKNRLAVAHDHKRVGHVVRDAEALEFEQRVHHGVGSRERAGRGGGKADLAGGRAIQGAGWLRHTLAVPHHPLRRGRRRRGILRP